MAGGTIELPDQCGAPPLHQGAVLSCAFLGEPRRLATGSVEGGVVVWDLETGAAPLRIESHVGPVRALAWDPRRRRLVSGGHDGRIVLADPESGARVASVAAGQGGLFALAVSPNGEVLASGGFDGLIVLWRLADGAPLGRLTGHNGRAVTDLDFLGERRLASCGRDCRVVVWDLDTGAALRTAGHARWAMRVRASADGRRLFSAGEDGRVCCWDARTGEQVWRYQRTAPFWGLERTPDGRALIAGMGGGVLRLELGDDRVGAVLDLAPETVRVIARCQAGAIALGADRLLIYRPDLPDAPLRRLETGAQQSSALAAVRRPDDTGRLSAVINRQDGGVELDRNGGRTALAPAHRGLAFAACAVGAELFATAGFDGQVHLRRAADGAHVRSFDHGGFVFTVGASADGARLLTAGGDRLALWDVATGRRLWGGQNLGVGFHCWASLTPDGLCAVTVGEDQTLHRWTFDGDETGYTRLALDTDKLIGTCGLMGVVMLDETTAALATAAGEVLRADLESGRTSLLHALHESGVRIFALSPDRRLSENCVGGVYDLLEGRVRTPPEMAASAVPAADFTAYGDLVWLDGHAGLHRLTPEALEQVS